MLTILPYRRIVLVSPLPPTELLSRLAQQIEPRRWLSSYRDRVSFQGEVRDMSFKIRRVAHYGNDFLPVIAGTWKPGRMFWSGVARPRASRSLDRLGVREINT